ncbi:MAG TPA: glycosyltransferase family 39 protein [Candidatus Baltobacteraceae bacterium]|jgi:hypothetical protein
MKRADIAWIAAIATLAFHLVGNPHYGFFRDELYFIICGRHPAWGYVDQPPLVPLIAAGSQLFGISLIALRATAALCAAAGVFVTCRLVRELSGGSFAQILAAICVALAGVLAAFGTQVGPDMIGLWAWPLAALFVVRIANGANPRWWIAVGTTIGVSFEAKYMVALFALALIGGIALTRYRTLLASPWFLAGLCTAVIIAMPNALWQALAGFPMLELLRNGTHGKNVVLSPVAFFAQQILILGPIVSIVWLIGLVWAFVQPRLRWLGWTYVLLIAATIALHGKNYYPADVYPLLFAVGAIAVEVWTVRARAIRPIAAVLAAAGALVLLPLAMPLLPVPTIVAYALALHLEGSIESEHHKQGQLPQDFADMHGWPQLAAAVAGVYDALPPADRKKAAIITENYGEAAAIDFFGTRYHLPPTLSRHNQYWLWGSRGYTGDVLIDVNGDCGKSIHLYRSSRLAATFSNPLGMPYERNMPIMVCRGSRESLAAIWPSIKLYI